VVCAEADRRVRKHEELDGGSARRSVKDDHDVAAHLLEAPVGVRARAGVAKDPAAAGARARKPDRGVMSLPWTSSVLHEPGQRRIRGLDEQADGCVRTTAQDRLREVSSEVPLRPDRRLVAPSASSTAHSQGAGDEDEDERDGGPDGHREPGRKLAAHEVARGRSAECVFEVAQALLEEVALHRVVDDLEGTQMLLAGLVETPETA
jgi:hypothetical protein